MTLENNVKDTALIFEGGGMRASYTAGMVSVLLEEKIYFNYVAGISAGASHTVNYLSRDIERNRRSFVDVVEDPNFGGWKSFLLGRGFFNAEYIYEKTPWPGGLLPFDFETFEKNPAAMRIGAVEEETGQLVYFDRSHVSCLLDLVRLVRASSSMPIFMPPTAIKDKVYVDGGAVNGLALDVAKKDGFKRFFVILTRPRGYQRKPFPRPKLLKLLLAKRPAVAQAMLDRDRAYNQTLKELKDLEKEGRAFLVYAEDMAVENMETDPARLRASYADGYAQARRSVADWKAFLGLEERG